MGTHPIFESDFDCLTVIQIVLKQISEKMSAELACTYAALILNDDDVEITGDKISTILKAANVQFEPFWPSLFAGALKDVNVRELITNIGSGVGSGPAAAGGGAAAGGAAEEEKVEEKKESSSESEDDDMGFGLFD